MNECKCGRKFTTPNGLSYHKKFCGKTRIYDGYEYFLNENGECIFVHRDVMEKKLGRKLKKEEIVHHINGNKRNNDPKNLELTNYSFHAKKHHLERTKEENYKRTKKQLETRFKNGNQTYQTCKLNVKQVIEIREKIKKGKGNSEIAREYNVSHATISNIRLGKSWKHILN